MTFQRIKDKNEITVIGVDTRFSTRGVVVCLRQEVDQGERLLFTDRPPIQGRGKGAANEGKRLVALL